MKFELLFTEHADEQLTELEQAKDRKVRCKAVHKILAFMEANLRHPSLNTHKYDAISDPNGEEVFESYAQNRTPGAYLFFGITDQIRDRSLFSKYVLILNIDLVKGAGSLRPAILKNKGSTFFT